MKRTLAIAALACALLLWGARFGGSARAQAVTPANPQVYITWRTVDGTAPSDYQGKILPKTGSQLEASVAVLLPNGTLADLSSQTIYWYLDDDFTGGGTGEQSISFTAPGHVEIMSLRVEIPNYPSGTLINTAHIRMVNPQVALVAPYLNGTFSGNSVEVQAFPYFFTLAELPKLTYQWTVNGQPVTSAENPLDLIVNLNGSTPSGYGLSISLGARQSDDPLTGAAGNITLTEQ